MDSRFRNIWHDDVKSMSDEELQNLAAYLHKKRCRLGRRLLSSEGVVLENSPVLFHTHKLKDAA
jgi:hypothetical protein